MDLTRSDSSRKSEKTYHIIILYNFTATNRRARAEKGKEGHIGNNVESMNFQRAQ
ncbi:MAG: hypothetical protein ACERKJ_10750 [Candidatus Dadabacteria bacterium]